MTAVMREETAGGHGLIPSPRTAPDSTAPDSTTPQAPPSVARQRLLALTDRGSFIEMGSQARHRTTAFEMHRKRPAGDGVVTGLGRIEERPVALYAQDSAVLGGSLGEMHAGKIVRIMDWAARARMPVVGRIDSGVARVQEGVGALDGYGSIFSANVRQSGRIPQISVILGPCAGGAVYSPALTDIVIMRRQREHMFLTGPKVVKAVTHEDVSAEELGGADLHARRSGVAHMVAAEADEALDLAQRVLSYLPASCWDELPMALPKDPEAMRPVPANLRQAYDVRG